MWFVFEAAISTLVGLGVVKLASRAYDKLEERKTVIKPPALTELPKLDEKATALLTLDTGRTWDDAYNGVKLYYTPKEHAVLASSFWRVKLPNGEERALSIEPLIDDRTGLYARMNYDDAAARWREFGGRLLTSDELQYIWDQGERIEPCPMGVGDEHARSLATARRHDACVRSQIAVRGFDFKRSISNIGKPWIHGAPSGRAWLFGWFRADGKPIQPRPPPGSRGPHDARYWDYSSTAYGSLPVT